MLPDLAGLCTIAGITLRFMQQKVKKSDIYSITIHTLENVMKPAFSPNVHLILGRRSLGSFIA